MDIYLSTLVVLVLPLIGATYWKWNFNDAQSNLFATPEDQQLQIIDEEIHDIDCETTLDRYHSFLLRFLPVYGLAIAADWLQVRSKFQRST